MVKIEMNESNILYIQKQFITLESLNFKSLLFDS